MRKAQVKLGGIYIAKISNRLTRVRLDRECVNRSGWIATNLVTGREVMIKSDAKDAGPAWHLYCKVCKKGFALRKTPEISIGNKLTLLDHARSHDGNHKSTEDS